MGKRKAATRLVYVCYQYLHVGALLQGRESIPRALSLDNHTARHVQSLCDSRADTRLLLDHKNRRSFQR